MRDGTKRALDAGLGLVGTIVFAPAQLAIGALILLDDGAPVLFPQRRVGRHRAPFTVYKLRTMRNDEVTRVGRWLRLTGLDETPQFWNVLRGEMSVVGPRPLTQADASATTRRAATSASTCARESPASRRSLGEGARVTPARSTPSTPGAPRPGSTSSWSRSRSA